MANGNGFGPNGTRMNIERFTEIVEAYGAEPDRWPETERAAAVEFAAIESAALKVLEQEQGLDLALASVERIEPSSQLVESILADAANVTEALIPIVGSEESGRQHRTVLGGLKGFIADLDAIDWSLKGLMQPGAVLACAALAGLATGIAVPADQSLDTLYTYEDTDVLSVAFGQADYDLEAWTLNGGGQ